ncbi:MAG TPA: hypothetical protein DEG23_04075, partial [Coxiellaceae bacterium]|nr:hypothetical protein [Coxiellaceae bacterium]
ALSEYYKSPTVVTIKLGANNMDTHANIKKREDSKKQDQALQSLEKDPKIKELMSKFDAKIIANSAKSEG